MKIIAFVGSPRNGSTKKLAEVALEAARKSGADTELAHIGRMKIAPCTACDACRKEGKCIIKDDFAKAEKLLESADGVIFASPVYFGGISAQMKAFIDRTRSLRRKRALRDKPAGAIAVGASRNGGQETAISEIHRFFLIQEMLIVSDEKTAHYGGTGHAGAGKDISDDTYGMETSRNLGTHVAEVAKKLVR